jgi:hypothetical protein
LLLGACFTVGNVPPFENTPLLIASRPGLGGTVTQLCVAWHLRHFGDGRVLKKPSTALRPNVVAVATLPRAPLASCAPRRQGVACCCTCSHPRYSTRPAVHLRRAFVALVTWLPHVEQHAVLAQEYANSHLLTPTAASASVLWLVPTTSATAPQTPRRNVLSICARAHVPAADPGRITTATEPVDTSRLAVSFLNLHAQLPARIQDSCHT